MSNIIRKIGICTGWFWTGIKTTNKEAETTHDEDKMVIYLVYQFCINEISNLNA